MNGQVAAHSRYPSCIYNRPKRKPSSLTALDLAKYLFLQILSWLSTNRLFGVCWCEYETRSNTSSAVFEYESRLLLLQPGFFVIYQLDTITYIIYVHTREQVHSSIVTYLSDYWCLAMAILQSPSSSPLSSPDSQAFSLLSILHPKVSNPAQ